jgi:hypothetical protein
MRASAKKEHPEASRLPETFAIAVTVHAAKLATLTEENPVAFLGMLVRCLDCLSDGQFNLIYY